MVEAGEQAPDFSMQGTDGKIYSLKDFKGKKLVLYFYPKDDTPGCTCEGKEFTQELSEFAENRVNVIGVSPDDVASHKKFTEKYGLKVLLLADTGAQTCQKYGVWVEKNNYGKKYMGVARTTFVIDENGVVVKKFAQVKPEGHAKEVLTCISGGMT